jgi:acyl carrier protein
MTRDDVRRSFIELLRPELKGVDSSSITDATSLITDLNINSLRIVDIALEAEDRFGIHVDNEAVKRFYTVGGSVDMILERKLAAA